MARAGNAIGIIAYGTSHNAVIEARDQLRAEENIETDYLRIRGFPFGPDITSWIEAHDIVYVVEQNRDGQMHQLLKLELPVAICCRKLQSVLHYDGMPIDARSIADGIKAAEAARK